MFCRPTGTKIGPDSFEMGTVSRIPLLLIPKRSTSLVTDSEVSDDIFINLNITTPDAEGIFHCLYNGLCNVKLLDEHEDVEIRSDSSNIYDNAEEPPDVNMPSTEPETQPDGPTEVWIDPMTSPYVYNRFDETLTQEQLSVYHETTSCVILGQSKTYITQNVYNYNEATHNIYNCKEASQKVYNCNEAGQNVYNSKEGTRNIYNCNEPTQNVYNSNEPTQNAYNYNEPTQNVYNYNGATQNVYNSTEPVRYSYHDDIVNKPILQQPEVTIYNADEYECGMFMSHLPEEIINETEIRSREERRYIGLQSQNGAVKQLMSTEIQSACKQRKTILLLEQDSWQGQTVQQIAYSDSDVDCYGDAVPKEDEHNVAIQQPPNLYQKKYQCVKCHTIFDQMCAFRNHMVKHSTPRPRKAKKAKPPAHTCFECGKVLRSKEKYEIHVLGHGDPNYECQQCLKVFANRFTLRAHAKIHNRKHACLFCTRTYSDTTSLHSHAAKIHGIFMCRYCQYKTNTYSELIEHNELHENNSNSDTETACPSFNEVSDSEEVDVDWNIEQASVNEVEHKYERAEADAVIAKVKSSNMFMRGQKSGRYNKRCDVCLKPFNRLSDLKRHLVEHVVRSTLAKIPVSRRGTLDIQCEICRSVFFTRIDKYKAHLRDHARLTLYKCTICDKTFSDSSNFSKHKKVHGTTFFQCDLCLRKFNSKKMLIRHMEYHNKNPPLQCCYCDKVFYFKSMIIKHIKMVHTKEFAAKFRCKFCHQYFQSLKKKWDHEWRVHRVRKMVVDCQVCGSQFRKYAELKKHCLIKHDLDIPNAKNLLKD